MNDIKNFLSEHTINGACLEFNVDTFVAFLYPSKLKFLIKIMHSL